MAKDYLKHYGVKKSRWSAEARNRYDAELRRKYGDNRDQASQNQRQQLHNRQRNPSGNTTAVQRRGAAHIPRNLVKTDTSSSYVTSRRLSKQLASRATRARQGGQVARVDANGSTVGANQKLNYNYAARKAAAKNNARFMSGRVPRVDTNGSTVGAGKKLNNVSAFELKKREAIGKFKSLFKINNKGKGRGDGSKHTDVRDEGKKAFERHKREAEKAYATQKAKERAYGAGQATSIILKRTLGKKSVSIDKNGKVYKLTPSTVTNAPRTRNDTGYTSRAISKNSKGIKDIVSNWWGSKLWKGIKQIHTRRKATKDYNKNLRELFKETDKSMFEKLKSSSRKRNDSGKTTTVYKRGPANTKEKRKLTARQEHDIRQKVLAYNHEKKTGSSSSYEDRWNQEAGKILKKKMADAKNERDYRIWQNIANGSHPAANVPGSGIDTDQSGGQHFTEKKRSKTNNKSSVKERRKHRR